MPNFDEPIFGKVTFSDLLKEIHKKSNEKDRQITDLVNQLKDMIRNINDAVTMVPLIKDYLSLSVQNNDQLVKMAAIVQKALDRSQNKESDTLFTEEEKAQLRLAAEQLQIDNTMPTKKQLS